MLVTFLRDFQGVNTREQFYHKGDVADFDGYTVRALLAEGAVEVVQVIEPVVEVPPPALTAPEPKKAAALKRTAAAKHKARD